MVFGTGKTFAERGTYLESLEFAIQLLQKSCKTFCREMVLTGDGVAWARQTSSHTKTKMTTDFFGLTRLGLRKRTYTSTQLQGLLTQVWNDLISTSPVKRRLNESV